MTNNILKASVAPVKLGHLEFEGLLIENGEFAIAQQQVAAIFQVIPTSAPEWMKRNLGKDTSLWGFKVKTNREAVEGKRVRKSETALNLISFEKLLRKLDRKGNLIAQSIVDDLVGVSLQKLFSDAFHIKFESEEMQAWLEKRQESKELFWNLANAIDTWYTATKEERTRPAQNYYTSAFDSINRGLFGKSAAIIREELGVGKGELNRDHFSREAIRRITQIRDIAARKMTIDKLRPVDAVRYALGASMFETINYK